MKSVIRDIHQQLTSGKYTCREFVQEKISSLRGNEYNSVNLLLDESALASADRVDEKIKTGKPLGLLEGIPFGIEDVILLQGSVASGSSDFLKNYTAPYTATAIKKLTDAGAIPVVKERCDSFGHGCASGAAINVAKGHSVFSICGDSGGSVRRATGYNKVYTMKSTYGRVSRYGLMANASSTDCIAPVATTLEDIRILINAISGKDTHDNTTCSSEPIQDNIFASKIDKERFTVGYYKSFIENLDVATKAAFRKMIEDISNQGVKVIPLDFFDTDLLVSTYYVLAMAETSSNFARLDGTVYGARSKNSMITRSECFTDETKRRIIGGSQVLSHGHDENVYLKARILKNQIISAFDGDFEKANILLSPVATALPPSPDNPLSMYLSDAYTVGFSLGGLPTLTAPLFTPAGIQVTANKNCEELILTFTNYLEEAEQWT